MNTKKMRSTSLFSPLHVNANAPRLCRLYTNHGVTVDHFNFRKTLPRWQQTKHTDMGTDSTLTCRAFLHTTNLHFTQWLFSAKSRRLVCTAGTMTPTYWTGWTFLPPAAAAGSKSQTLPLHRQVEVHETEVTYETLKTSLTSESRSSRTY